MSLNMPEDDKCYLSTNIVEPTENFEEWLDKNQVLVVTNETEDAIKDKKEDNEIGLFLNQICKDFSHVRENECSSPKPSGSEICDIELVDKFDLNYRIMFFQNKFLEGIQAEFLVNNQNISVKINDLKNNSIDFPKLSIMSGRKSSQKVFPKENVKLKVKSIEKIQLADNLNATMPSLHLETGLKLNICPRHGCDLVYTNLSNAKLHALTHIGFKPYKCIKPRCQWEFYTKMKLDRHLYTHDKSKEFTCTEENCGKKFSNVSNLKVHIRNHKRPATIPCSVKTCKQVFQTHRLREKHLRTHDKSEAPYVCPEPNCNRSFFLLMGLSSHAKSHSYNESDLTCNFANCGKVFSSPCRLDEHKRKHTGVKPYVCTFDKCKWRFASASKLKRHQTTHLGERKFHCTIGDCKKSFMRSEHLKDHTLTHIDPRGFKCEYCEKYLSKFCMKRHIKRRHPNQSKEACARAVPYLQTSDKVTSDTLLEQAIQSLGVPSDTMLGSGLIPDESLELLDNKSFSTVNLRDLD